MFLSVIVPVYNVEKYLAECADSILSQTFADFELILVDDGSYDASPQICDDYAKRDERVKVIHKANGGQATARNAGFLQASGEYILYIDSDDFITDTHFFEDVYNMAQNGCDIILYKYCKYYDAAKQLGACSFTFADIAQDSDKTEILTRLVQKDAFFCSAWSKSIKRSLLAKNNILFDATLSCEDMDWYYRVIAYAGKFALLDKSYIAYRQRSNSVTSSGNLKAIGDFVTVIGNWFKEFEGLQDDKLRFTMLSSLAKLYTNLLVAYNRCADRDKRKYRRTIKKYRGLLRYNLNVRVRMINRLYRIAGFGPTMLALKLADRSGRQ